MSIDVSLCVSFLPIIFCFHLSWVLRWPYVVNGTLHPRTLFPPPPFPRWKNQLSLFPPPHPPSSGDPLSLLFFVSCLLLPPPPHTPHTHTFLSWPYAVNDIKIQELILRLFPLPSLSHIWPGFSSGLIQVKLHPVSMLAEVTEVSATQETKTRWFFS